MGLWEVLGSSPNADKTNKSKETFLPIKKSVYGSGGGISCHFDVSCGAYFC